MGRSVSNSYMFSLHRYFIWADRLRNQFIDTLKGKPVQELAAKKQVSFETNMTMSYWCAAMYVVIEGWRDLKLTDPKIEKLLESSYVDLVKQYRQSVCHFQKIILKKSISFLSKKARRRWSGCSLCFRH